MEASHALQIMAARAGFPLDPHKYAAHFTVCHFQHTISEIVLVNLRHTGECGGAVEICLSSTWVSEPAVLGCWKRIAL